MTTEEKVPLLEAIFELRWGQTTPGNFEYEQEEISFFPGQISTICHAKEYKNAEIINQQLPLSNVPPMVVTHRFRKSPNTWPCFQLGVGVFTVNQIQEGYTWENFKNAIEIGLDIFVNADPLKLPKISKSLSLILKYQNAFFPSEEIKTQDFLHNTLNINNNLPKSFFEYKDLNQEIEEMNFVFKTSSNDPKASITIMIANAIINDKKGFLFETTISSQAEDITKDISTAAITQWAEESHQLALHAFHTLLK